MSSTQTAWRKVLPRAKSMNHLAHFVYELLIVKDAYHSRSLCMLPSDPLAGIKALVSLQVVLVGVAAAQTLLAMIMSSREISPRLCGSLFRNRFKNPFKGRIGKDLFGGRVFRKVSSSSSSGQQDDHQLPGTKPDQSMK